MKLNKSTLRVVKPAVSTALIIAAYAMLVKSVQFFFYVFGM
ncbi:hypothetical protein [Peptoniphilus asaccharolyticus]